MRYKAHCGELLPSSIHWQWIMPTTDGRFSAYYCNEGICRDLGVFYHVQDANTAVVQEIREHIRSGLRRLKASES